MAATPVLNNRRAKSYMRIAKHPELDAGTLNIAHSSWAYTGRAAGIVVAVPLLGLPFALAAALGLLTAWHGWGSSAN